MIVYVLRQHIDMEDYIAEHFVSCFRNMELAKGYVESSIEFQQVQWDDINYTSSRGKSSFRNVDYIITKVPIVLSPEQFDNIDRN